MITVYKNRRDIVQEKKLIEFNDLFFNQHIIERLDMRAKDIIKNIDGAELREDFCILSGINQELLNIDKLSTGCKTVMNIFYFPENVFSVKECGDNALDVIYSLEEGAIFCEYPVISLFMKEVQVFDEKKIRVIDDYQKLKEWWKDV